VTVVVHRLPEPGVDELPAGGAGAYITEIHRPFTDMVSRGTIHVRLDGNHYDALLQDPRTEAERAAAQGERPAAGGAREEYNLTEDGPSGMDEDANDENARPAAGAPNRSHM